MTSRNLVTIRYIKQSNGRTVKRKLEPYSFRENGFFGYDVRARQIKRFITSRILDVSIEDKLFKPRWRVEKKSRFESLELPPLPVYRAVDEDDAEDLDRLERLISR